MSEILPGLYLGKKKDAKNRSWIGQMNISSILSVHATAKPEAPDRMTCKCIRIKDKSSVKIDKYFEECIQFIHAARLNGNNVLVHCRRGKSRSATICIAYLMHILGVSYSDAYKAVKARRGKIHPNSGFRKQLRQYESLLKYMDQMDYAAKNSDIFFFKQSLEMRFSGSNSSPNSDNSDDSFDE